MLMSKAIKLHKISGHARISVPYINQSKQLKKYNHSIPKETSSAFFVLRDLIICGSINNVPTVAAVKPIISVIIAILKQYCLQYKKFSEPYCTT